jgi:asparagine synthase (glutamine-hydrolysing)
MCGICGYYSPSAEFNPATLEQATSTLTHRGPDGANTWAHPCSIAGFGHTRLAIIDIAGGQQPMHSTDGRLTIVFNGEIYNYRELRHELESLGHLFQTHSDTEVLLTAYREWGSGSLIRLSGMFAFAVFDNIERKLFLARDRTGIKPLYYCIGPKGIVFGSELKALLAWAETPRRINARALLDFLMLTYPLPPSTCFQDCHELQPGCFLEFSGSAPRINKYWTWSPQLHATSSDPLDSLDRELQGAVREHLVSDVPVGAFLSGGIDSSLLVALIAATNSMSKLQTFNVKFAEDAYDESEYARAVAAHVGTQHHQLEIHAGDLSLVETVLDQFDQPFADSSAIPTYLICREIRNHVKVVVSGDGGDEMFGGYPSFAHADAIHLLSAMPTCLLHATESAVSKLRGFSPDTKRQSMRLLRAASLPGEKRLFDLSSIYGAAEICRVLQPDFTSVLAGYQPNFSPGTDDCADGRALIDITVKAVLPGDYLRKVDITSSAHGLEVRVPMLANRLLAFAAGLSKVHKYSWRTNKVLLRRLARKYLPPEVARKRKQGFGIPLDSWLGKSGRKAVSAMLLDPAARIQQLIRQDYIEELMGHFVTQKWDRSRLSRYSVYQRAYALWSLERWLLRWNPIL